MALLRTFRAKSLAAFTALCLAGIAIFAVVAHKMIPAACARMARENYLRTARTFAAVAETRLRLRGFQGQAEPLAVPAGENAEDFIVIVDEQGRELAFSGPQDAKSALPTVVSWPGAQSGRNESVGGRPYFLIRLPIQITGGDGRRGDILFGFSCKATDEAGRRIATTTVRISLLVLALAWLGFALIHHRLTRPINRLKLGMEAIARGDTGLRLQVGGDDEFSLCSGQVNELLQRSESLVRELSSTRKDLEDQVAARARELQLSNQKLQQAMQELRDSHTQAVQSEKQKSLTAIVSGFAHEINNPLTGIMGYIDLLVIRDDVTPYIREKLLGVQKQALRIKTIIEQLNQLSPDTEQTKLNINLSNLLEKLVKVVFSKPENQDILVEKVNFTENVPVFGNHFALWQVFEGVIENSVEAIHESHGSGGGRLIVSLKQSMDGHFAVVEIHDNGGGFKNLEKAFDPFYTTKSRTKKKGIGLSIAYNIIQEHRGNITIGNNSVGGATVSIYLRMEGTSEKR